MVVVVRSYLAGLCVVLRHLLLDEASPPFARTSSVWICVSFAVLSRVGRGIHALFRHHSLVVRVTFEKHKSNENAFIDGRW